MQTARQEPGSEIVRQADEIEAELSRTAAALREALGIELV
jgi:hypothetical protein